MRRPVGGCGSSRYMGYVWVVIVGCCEDGAALFTCRLFVVAGRLAEGSGLQELSVGGGGARRDEAGHRGGA